MPRAAETQTALSLWEGRPDRLDWPGLTISPTRSPQQQDSESRGTSGEADSGLQQPLPPGTVCGIARSPGGLQHGGGHLLPTQAPNWLRAPGFFFSPGGSQNVQPQHMKAGGPTKGK